MNETLLADELDLVSRLAQHISLHGSRLRESPLSSPVTPGEIRAHLEARYSFGHAQPMGELFHDVVDMLWKWAEHARNPMHFGLTRPTVDVSSIVADALVALYDPNLATWNFAPAAIEIERYVLDHLGTALGFPMGETSSHFTSGGQEANHSAVVVAVTHRYSAISSEGLRSLPGQPLFYMSEEGHHSLEKVAHSTGLGRRALRIVPADDHLRMDVRALVEMIRSDRAAGHLPFLVVGTAGTTSAGAIDPLDDLADVAARHELWFHVDAAWGGAAALSAHLRPLLKGIERSDSVTFDAHKWLSVPAGAGALFCRHRGAVEAAFRVDTPYVPQRAQDSGPDPYATTMQWSRRFIGLKVFMMLAARGLPEIVRRIEHQAALGHTLANLLEARGWQVVNEPNLTVVCFTHPRIEEGAVAAPEIARRLKESQTAWISDTLLRGNTRVLRASVTHHETQQKDIEALVDALDKALV